MEEELKTATRNHKEGKKLVINVGGVAAVSGSFGGVGMIFLGGVMATTAFAFLFRRRLRRREKFSGDAQNKNRNHGNNLPDVSMTVEVPAGGKFVAAGNYKGEEEEHFSDDMQKDERNGSLSNSRVNENYDGFLAQELNIFQDPKSRSRNEDPLCTDEEAINVSSPTILLVGNTVFDDDELTLPIFSDEKMENYDGNGRVIFDQETEKGCRDIFVDHQGDKMNSDIREVINCPESSDEMTKSMSACEELEPKIHADHERKNFGNSLARISDLEEDFFQPVEGNVSVSNDRKMVNQEEHEKGSKDRDKGGTRNQRVENYDEHFGVDETHEKDAENEFKGIQQPVEFTLNLKEKLQMPMTKQFVKMQALMTLNKVHNVGITEKILLRKGNLGENSFKLSLFGRYILQLVELTQTTTNTHKQRILVFTVLVLSGSLRIWYFSRPFLKIILMHFRNYLLIKLHLQIRSFFRSHLRNHLRIKIIRKMLGI
ncbi:OLC1v1005313C1 [Oldenlandia corymbosa var. corymbosa]|uniref:OLC1v1005313C1 n=1 Tax=Oldenlandia corymbosa var. corymbosa TaxID=529605 RepID=A0AAV1DEB8_OLDCO|nr:OLC1v1005313C1 [Oldenlandia corymbosa var. corymbosa]